MHCSVSFNIFTTEGNMIGVFRTLEDFRPTMETGVPELDLPPLDPMSIDQIGFTFWNVTAEFLDTKLRGFKSFKLKYSKADRQKR